MSKWKHKTPEEKAQTLKNLEQNKKVHKPKHIVQMEKDKNLRIEILEQGEIPLRCPTCNIATSKHYTWVKAHTPLGIMQMIIGNCTRCGKEAKVIIEPSVIGFEFSMILSQALSMLNFAGRVTDDRNGKLREMLF